MEGLLVDPLTVDFLDIASDPNLGQSVDGSLRDYFHDARNRLSLLKLSLYLAKRNSGEDRSAVWNELDQSYLGLVALVERVAAICGPSRSDPVSGGLGSWLEERRATWTGWLASRGRTLDWVGPASDAFGRFDPKRLIEGLDALIGWRASAGGQGEPARLVWGVEGEDLSIVWSEPYARVDEPIEGRESRALSMALPVLARVMADHGGLLVVTAVDGLNVRLTWPGGHAEAQPT